MSLKLTPVIAYLHKQVPSRRYLNDLPEPDSFNKVLDLQGKYFHEVFLKPTPVIKSAQIEKSTLLPSLFLQRDPQLDPFETKLNKMFLLINIQINLTPAMLLITAY